MSRAVVYDAILADGQLGMDDITFDAGNVKVNYDGDQRPNDRMFIVLRWEAPDIDLRGDDSTIRKGGHHLSVWVHMYQEFSTDFTRIDKVIDALDKLLVDIIDRPGSDGRTLVMVEPEGHSRDLRDVTYETFCRSASYKVLSRAT
ncbi:hypothetical protein SEA_LEOPARD_30 [Mycobacterium phage Leopard]|uniref:Tail terminator n=1 Tax=Mycobacterium phage Onyinye TaxID=2686235 RepID=A0A6B9L6V2_9CAUD|nr:hypothetical protein PP339_gp031 [Mycobacterium phage Onyinye]QHB37437.1 hypothetical protein SEA_ONYINYE_31 [Mycobacterium phage Onyinye]UOW92908.1 hypothetical protein SEA_LEOPARD_30 [Mycobacterium phage Leopard]WKW85192.1 tail terminator [Mycobacterium phage Aikoy]